MATEQPMQEPTEPTSEIGRAWRHYLGSSDCRALLCAITDSRPASEFLMQAFVAGWRMRSDALRDPLRLAIPDRIAQTLLRILARAEVRDHDRLEAMAWVGARC